MTTDCNQSLYLKSRNDLLWSVTLAGQQKLNTTLVCRWLPLLSICLLRSYFFQFSSMLAPHPLGEMWQSDSEDQCALFLNEMLNSLWDVSHSNYHCTKHYVPRWNSTMLTTLEFISTLCTCTCTIIYSLLSHLEANIVCLDSLNNWWIWTIIKSQSISYLINLKRE